MDYSIYSALERKLKGDIAVAKTNIEIYMTTAVGIGEHIDIVETVEKELAKLAEAEDKLQTLNSSFSVDRD